MALPFDNLKPILIEIALAAGLAIEKCVKQGYNTFSKADSSMLTDADMAANDIIVSRLKTLFPNAVIISEESEEYCGAGLVSGDWFLIDPLDGTRGFTKGSKEYTVNIAFIRNSAPVAGVVFAPALGELYYGDIESGATFAKVENDKITDEKPIVAQSQSQPARLLVSLHHLDPQTQYFVAKFECPKVTQMNSSIKLCKIAAGDGDIYPRFGPTSQWDTAAGQAVLEAAGGKVLQFNGEILRYGNTDRNGNLMLNPNFVACGAFVPEFLPFSVDE